MAPEPDDYGDDRDEAYFDRRDPGPRGFDTSLLHQPIDLLSGRKPLVFGPEDTVTEAMRAMQRDSRGAVLITEDGTTDSRLIGIFTERDVLFRIIDRGQNPATLPLRQVMTPDPESLPADARLAWVLNMMSVGGFRHVPVVDDHGRPVHLVSVKDVVEFLVEAFPREVLNLPTEFRPPMTRTREGA